MRLASTRSAPPTNHPLTKPRSKLYVVMRLSLQGATSGLAWPWSFRYPVHGAAVDFSRLRAGGILALLSASKVGEDPEYQSFVHQTDFDYKQDLDAAIVAFAPRGKYMLLKGRFDWKNLIAYVH